MLSVASCEKGKASYHSDPSILQDLGYKTAFSKETAIREAMLQNFVLKKQVKMSVTTAERIWVFNWITCWLPIEILASQHEAQRWILSRAHYYVIHFRLPYFSCYCMCHIIFQLAYFPHRNPTERKIKGSLFNAQHECKHLIKYVV